VSFEKNINLVIDAYKGMDHSSCHLVLVGHGPAFNEIERDCVKSGIPVTLTGYLQGSDLSEAYASADVFAFPSVTETFGQVVLEAMASGLPVVGLLAEGVCDLVEHGRTGLLLDTNSYQNASSSDHSINYRLLLKRLVQNRSLRESMSKEARKSAKKYTWYEAMERMVRVYNDAVAPVPTGVRIIDDRTSRDSPFILPKHLSTESVIGEGSDTIESKSIEEEDSGVEEDYSPYHFSHSVLSLPNTKPQKPVAMAS
jgi:glycogen synthase